MTLDADIKSQLTQYLQLMESDIVLKVSARYLIKFQMKC